MNINEERIEDTRVLSLEFENLDATAASQLRAEFVPTIKLHERLLLQMAQVQFMDSGGMSLLRRMRSVAGDETFGIVAVTDRMMDCLRRFPQEAWPRIFETVEQAHACDFQRLPITDPRDACQDDVDQDEDDAVQDEDEDRQDSMELDQAEVERQPEDEIEAKQTRKSFFSWRKRDAESTAEESWNREQVT